MFENRPATLPTGPTGSLPSPNIPTFMSKSVAVRNSTCFVARRERKRERTKKRTEDDDDDDDGEEEEEEQEKEEEEEEEEQRDQRSLSSKIKYTQVWWSRMDH